MSRELLIRVINDLCEQDTLTSETINLIEKELAKTEPKTKIGDIITVDKWLSHRDYSYCGDILEVMEMDYPLIRVNRKNKSYLEKNITLDLRNVEIRKLSKPFVDDVMKNIKHRKQK